MASLMPSQIAGTKTLQVDLSHKVQRQHSVPDEKVPLPTPLGLEESRFPVVLSEEITEIKKKVSCKQKHKANHANMVDSVDEVV